MQNISFNEKYLPSELWKISEYISLTHKGLFKDTRTLSISNTLYLEHPLSRTLSLSISNKSLGPLRVRDRESIVSTSQGRIRRRGGGVCSAPPPPPKNFLYDYDHQSDLSHSRLFLNNVFYTFLKQAKR